MKPHIHAFSALGTASLMSMNPATGTTEVIAHGPRNTVGFAWHPGTGLKGPG